jgi:hypothetical protein
MLLCSLLSASRKGVQAAVSGFSFLLQVSSPVASLPALRFGAQESDGTLFV